MVDINKTKAQLVEEVEALRDTAAALNSTLDLDEVLDRILVNLAHVVPHDAADVMLIKSGVARVARCRGFAQYGSETAVLALRFPVAEIDSLRRMSQNGQPLAIPDTRANPEWVVFPEASWIRSYVGAPIRLGGEVIGFLSLHSATPGFFTLAHAERLQAFADQAAIAIHNARLFEAERRERTLAQTLQKTAEALARSVKLEDTLDLIVEYLGEVVPNNWAMAMLVEEDQLRVVAARGFSAEGQLLGKTFSYPDIPLIHESMATGESLVVTDAQHDPRWVRLPDGMTEARGWLGAPLVAWDVVIGFISVGSKQPDAYGERDKKAIKTLAQQAALAVERARMLTKLEDSFSELQRTQSDLMRATRLSAAGKIAAGVAHQINNPMTTVIAHSYLLLKKLTPDNPAYKSALAIKEAADRAGSVVQRLLDLARPTPYVIEPVDVNLSVQNAILLVRIQIEPAAQLVAETALGLPLIEGSNERLEEVWLNLLLNARDAIGDSTGGIVKVTTALSEGGDAIEVCVRDNGAGILPEHLEHIFKSFYTTKEYGTGLGLPTAEEIVKLHGGSIQVESEESQGTIFTVRLPLQQTKG
jgi:signal transduction histidine kinase